MKINFAKQEPSSQLHNSESCPVCYYNGTMSIVLTGDIAFGTNQKYIYAHCPNCRHLWLKLHNTVASQRFSEPSEPFVTAVMEHPLVSLAIYRPRVRWLEKSIYFGRNTKVLDLGCGTGNFLRLIKREFGCICEGIDIDPFFNSFGHEDGISIKTANFEEFNPAEQYNLITMFHFIEHLNNPLLALQKAYDLLLPGGYLCIETPASDAWAFNIFRGYWFPLLPPYHRHIFSRRSLALLIDMLPNSKVVAASNVYISGEAVSSINLPLANYLPHPFQKRRIQIWKALLALLGTVALTTLSMPLEIFIAGTTKYLNIASHQRVLLRKG